MTSYDERPISGRASPWGLDLDIHREGDEVVAALTLRSAHEGAPGRSHGGIVAALFDDVYGFVLTILAQPAFTDAATTTARPRGARIARWPSPGATIDRNAASAHAPAPVRVAACRSVLFSGITCSSAVVLPAVSPSTLQFDE